MEQSESGCRRASHEHTRYAVPSVRPCIEYLDGFFFSLGKLPLGLIVEDHFIPLAAYIRGVRRRRYVGLFCCLSIWGLRRGVFFESIGGFRWQKREFGSDPRRAGRAAEETAELRKGQSHAAHVGQRAKELKGREDREDREDRDLVVERRKMQHFFHVKVTKRWAVITRGLSTGSEIQKPPSSHAKKSLSSEDDTEVTGSNSKRPLEGHTLEKTL